VSPVNLVLGILGKRYPQTFQEFTAMRMEGAFDSSRAGTRMKLAVPETWETQVSLNGNTAETWQTLLEHRKLPFMAMLRNLRNMLLANMNNRYHNKVMSTLQSRRAVLNSRQFPFRFFSAYKVLSEIRDMKAKPGQVLPSAARVKSYRQALDTAVKIATRGNVKPIHGTTLLFCNVSDSMRQKCPTARGIGASSNRLEAALLLGLMCKYSCERCDFHLFSHAKPPTLNVELEEGTILHNLEYLQTLAADHSMDWQHMAMGGPGLAKKGPGGFPIDVLHSSLKARRQVDKIIVLSDDGSPSTDLVEFADRYRWQMNPDLLFVHVDLSGAVSGVATKAPSARLSTQDITIAGFSDAILRYIADRGDGADQVSAVETINATYRILQKPLATTTVKKPGDDAVSRTSSMASDVHAGDTATCRPAAQSNRAIKVFISSTFRDMHGERDILTRYVFPELRARAAPFGIDINEVDLRWGVTEEMAQNAETLALCLDEISSSDFFIGLLGERYGWVGDQYAVPDEPRFQWLRDYPQGRSITEVEMHHAALGPNPSTRGRRALFAIRNPVVLQDVPEAVFGDFVSACENDSKRLAKLKERVREATKGNHDVSLCECQLLDDYDATWDKTCNLGKPAFGGLEKFAAYILEGLWRFVLERFNIDTSNPNRHVATAVSPLAILHEQQAFADRTGSNFIGCESLLKDVVDWSESSAEDCGLRLVTAGAGRGKSSFLARCVQLLQSKSTPVVFYFGGTSAANSTATAMLSAVCYGLNQVLRMDTEVPSSYLGLKAAFTRLLGAAAKKVSAPVVVVIDGVDNMGSATVPSIDWIPKAIPKGSKILLAAGNARVVKAIQDHDECKYSKLPAMRPSQSREFIRRTLGGYSKVLDESSQNNQLDILVSKQDAGSPVYLEVACEEIRVFSVYERLTSFITALPGSLEGLYAQVLDRLEADVGHAAIEGSVQLVLLSRDGLSSSELRKQLKFVLGVDTPPMPFARLWRNFAPFLSVSNEAEGLVSIVNGTLKTAVKERYRLDSSTLMKRHRQLARYFIAVADPSGDKSFRGRNRGSLLSLPYHLTRGALWSELASVLGSLAFVQAKCAVGLSSELLSDYQHSDGLSRVQSAGLDRILEQSSVTGMRDFIARNLRFVGVNPTLTLQQAINENEGTCARQQADALYSNLARTISLYQWANKPDAFTNCEVAIEDGIAELSAVAYNPNGLYCAVGDKDGTVRVYELSTARLVVSLSLHASAVSALSYCGTSTLCSAGWDLSIVFWDVAKGVERCRKTAHASFCRRISCITSNQEETHVVATSWDGTARCFRCSDGYAEAEYVHPDGVPFNSAAWYSNGGLVLLGDWVGKVTCWDPTATFATVAFDAHGGNSVRSLSVSTEGRLLTASIQGEVKLWTPVGQAVAMEDPDVEVPQVPTGFRVIGTYDAGSLSIESVAFANGGKHVILAAGDLLQVLDSQIGIPKMAPFGRRDDIGPISATSEIRDGFIAIGHHAGVVQVCRTDSGAVVDEVSAHANGAVVALSLSPKLRTLAVATVASSRVWLYTCRDEKDVSRSRWGLSCALDAEGGHVRSIACGDALRGGPFREKFAVGLSDGVVNLWGHCKSVEGRGAAKLLAELNGHDNAVSDLVFLKGAVVHAMRKATEPAITRNQSRNEKIADHLLSSSHDGSVRMWNTDTAECVDVHWDVHSDWINAMALSPDKKLVATASNDCTICVRWTEDGRDCTKLTGHTAAVTSLTFLSNDVVASVGLDGTVRFWSLELDLQLSVLSVDGGVSVCAGLDGSCVVTQLSGVQEHSMRFGACLATLDGHRGPISCVAVGPHDRVITCGRLDRTLCSWKTERLERIDARHSCAVTSVTTWQAGSITMVCSGDANGALRTWKMDSDQGVSLTLVAHLQGAHALAVSAAAVAPNGALYTAGADGKLCRWDWKLRLEATLHDTASPLSALAISSRGTIATGGWDGMVYTFIPKSENLWDGYVSSKQPINSRRRQVQVDDPACRAEWINSLDFRSDLADAGCFLTAATLDGTVEQLHCGAHCEDFVQCSVTNVDLGMTASETFQAHRKKLECVASVDSHRTIVAADSTGHCQMYDTALPEATLSFVAHRSRVTSVAQLARGHFVTSSMDSRVRMWRMDGEDPSVVHQQGEYSCRSGVTALSVNGNAVFCGDQLGYVYALRPLTADSE